MNFCGCPHHKCCTLRLHLNYSSRTPQKPSKIQYTFQTGYYLSKNKIMDKLNLKIDIKLIPQKSIFTTNYIFTMHKTNKKCSQVF